MRKIFFICLFSVLSLGLSAQGAGQKKGGPRHFDPQKFEAQLEEYVMKKAGFTTAESEKFLPIFREMRKKEVQVMKSSRNAFRGRPTTDKECEEAIRNHDNCEVQLKKIKQTYHARMLKVVPASKTMKAIHAHDDFHREAFRKVEDMKREGKGKGHHGGNRHRGNNHPAKRNGQK